MSETEPELRRLYCHCQYARVLPAETKEAVLDGLLAAGQPFEAVPDLCEMSARKDPRLKALAAGPLRIAACFPRAVQWLFAAGGADLPEGASVLNMREASAEDVIAAMTQGEQP